MLKSGDIVVYIGNNKCELINDEQYRIRFVGVTLTTKTSLIMLLDYERLGYINYVNNFISIKEYRKQKINKICLSQEIE